MSDDGSIRDECAHVFSALPEWGPDQLMVCEKNCGMRATMQDSSRLTALESGIQALADEDEKRAAELYEDAGGDPAVEAEAWTLNSNAIALRSLANECDPSRTQGEKP